MEIDGPPQIPVFLLMGKAMHELPLESQALLPAAMGEGFQLGINAGQEAPENQKEGRAQASRHQ
jgi:hypothetical protein